jgi:hypothetical protein
MGCALIRMKMANCHSSSRVERISRLTDWCCMALVIIASEGCWRLQISNLSHPPSVCPKGRARAFGRDLRLHPPPPSRTRLSESVAVRSGVLGFVRCFRVGPERDSASRVLGPRLYHMVADAWSSRLAWIRWSNPPLHRYSRN